MIPNLPWKLIGAGAVAIVIAVLILLWKGEQRHSAKLQARVELLTSLREQDKRNIEAASREAQRINRETVARIKADQDRITQEASREYQSDLARLRRELAVRLSGASKANPGRPGEGGAGAVPDTAGGADGETVPVPAGDLLYAAETELQLMRLQEWIEQQTKVVR